MSKNNKFINVDDTTSDILLEGIIDQKKIKQKITKIDVSNSIKDNNETEFKNLANSEISNNSLNLIQEDNESSSNSSKSKRKYTKKSNDQKSESSKSSNIKEKNKLFDNDDLRSKTDNIFNNNLTKNKKPVNNNDNINDNKKDNNINDNKKDNPMDKASVTIAKTFLLFIIQFIEFINNRYDPLGLDLDGWSNQLNSELDNHNEILYKILQKYKGNTETEPEIQLLMAVVMSGVTFHFTKTLNKGVSNMFQFGNNNNNNNDEKKNININIKKDDENKNKNKKIIEDLKNKVGINMDYSSYTE